MVERPAFAFGHLCIRKLLRLFRAQAGAGNGPGQKPRGIGVNDTVVTFVREHQHRPRRVRTNARQRQQVIEVVRQDPVVTLERERGSTVQVQCPAVVAKPLPGAQHRTDRSGSTCRGGRKLGQKLLIPVDDPRDLGLLEHQLSNQDRPRITGATPRHIPKRLFPPRQQLARTGLVEWPRIHVHLNRLSRSGSRHLIRHLDRGLSRTQDNE